MVGRIEARLAALGVELPQLVVPQANYLPLTVSPPFLFTAGQIPLSKGVVAFHGRLGADCDLEKGYRAARLCALNILSVAKAQLGDLDRITRILKLVGFVNCTLEFTDQSKVINGASDFMVEVFGDIGRHARSAVGVAALPFGVPVEVEAIIEFSEN